MHFFDKNLAQIIKSLKSSYGSDFFDSLTLQLHQLIGADYTFIAKLDKARYVSQTISLVAKGNKADNFEYSLTDTPCADVSDNSVCIYPRDICALYPNDQLLIDMKIDGYLGAPLHDSNGDVMGLIVALYETEITNGDEVVALFELFSGRISAEIEREDKELQLKYLNNSLEDKVNRRTQELSQAIEHLKVTQDKLIEQEKMASLGNLVAGVAHEVNTPLGVAILSGSNIEDAVSKLVTQFNGNSLTKTALEQGLVTLKTSQEALMFNLQRAANLVDSFKEMAVGANIDELTEINFNLWLNSLVESLKPMLKNKNISIELNINALTISFITYPSKMSQVITNIIANCAAHAFDELTSNRPHEIKISASFSDEQLTINICDNGKGMSEEVLQRIFEPFYTTKRGKGGAGLGLSIVHNIVNNSLKGDLQVSSTLKQGSCFHLTLPSLT